MDRQFDYSQKILLAVEFSPTPRQLARKGIEMPHTYSVFQRLPIAEVMSAFEETEGLLVRLLAGRKFHNVLDQHMG